MSMTQLIIGTALGFFVAQGVLYSIRHLIGWLQRSDARKRILKPTPSLGSAFISAFIKYAAPVGAGAAVITLGVWAVGDHLAAKSARSAATADVFKRSTLVPASDSHGSPDELVRPASASRVGRSTAVAADNLDPYADSDFKVQRHSHRPGSALSLKETLLQRSEAKACAELLRETQQRLSRSQYDCEAADRAGKYLKAGLDVWGFAAWQIRHFPMDGYKGATLPQCKDVKDIVDHSSSVDLQSAVAQEHHP
jgi:hypothetical protein